MVSTGYKILALAAHLHSDSCTSCSCLLFHSTGVVIATMQLAKVVIVSALVLVACVEVLPEGKLCVEGYKIISYFGPWLL